MDIEITVDATEFEREECPVRNLTGAILEYHLRHQVRYLKEELGRVKVERDLLQRMVSEMSGRGKFVQKS